MPGGRTREVTAPTVPWVGLHDLYEFDLVPLDPDATVSTEHWPAIQHRLLHFQPAKSVKTVGKPPRAIRVVAIGGVEVAPGLLAEVERLAGTRLKVVPADR